MNGIHLLTLIIHLWILVSRHGWHHFLMTLPGKAIRDDFRALKSALLRLISALYGF